MLKDLDITPDDPAELRAVNRLLADEVKSQALLIEKLKHQLAGQNRHRFGVRSESLDQLNLTFEEDEEIAEAADKQAKPAQPPVEDKAPRQHSRKPLPDHLERHDEVLSPGDDCTRCGGKLKTLGEDITEELEYVPGRFKVKRIIRPRKACSCCEAIVQVPLPSRPIERGRAGAGSVGACAGQQIRRSSAALSPKPDLCPRRDRSGSIHDGRLGWPVNGAAGTTGR